MEKNVILNVEYIMKPGGAKAFVQEVTESGILADILSHEGCLRYEYFVPMDGGENLLLVERWTNAEALAKHAAQPCMAQVRAIKEKYATDTKLEKYTVLE